MHHITRCLNPKLMTLCERAIQLEELGHLLIDYLPSALTAHCSVGGFNHGCLHLITDNQVWASELRFAIPELRDALRSKAGIYQLASIKISIAEQEHHSIKKPIRHNKNQLSTTARETIAASTIQCNYPPLKAALEHLMRDDVL